jgi:hypothetical protein
MRLDRMRHLWGRLLRLGQGLAAAPRAQLVCWGRGLAAIGLLVLALPVVLLWAAVLTLITPAAGARRMSRQRQSCRRTPSPSPLRDVTPRAG